MLYSDTEEQADDVTEVPLPKSHTTNENLGDNFVS